MCFYAAVHIINGHIASKHNLHYRSHKQVKNAISPYKSIPIGTEVSPELYKCYVKLQNLSRRSRYLCLDADEVPENEICYLTYDKHLKKAIVQLDKIISFIVDEYGSSFPKINLDCIEMKGSTYRFFAYSKDTAAA